MTFTRIHKLLWKLNMKGCIAVSLPQQHQSKCQSAQRQQQVELNKRVCRAWKTFRLHWFSCDTHPSRMMIGLMDIEFRRDLSFSSYEY